MNILFRGLAKGFIFLAIVFVCSPIVFSQVDERMIKLSGNYFWGEGFGEDRQTAVNNAKRDLIERMIVRIESEANFSERDTNDEYQVELETTTNTMSRMELRGLNYLPAEERRDGSWEAIAYVSREDFNATMATEEARLQSALAIALQDEEDGRLDSAIPQYMDILASTFYAPVPFYAVISDADSVEMRAFLTGKIRNWINTLDIQIINVRSLSTAQNSEFYFDLGFQYNSMKTSNLEIRLNKMGYASHPIRNGRASIFYDLPPEDIIRSFTFIITPIIPNTIENEKSIILEGILPIREVTLDIDFADVIDIDFDVEVNEDGNYIFRPEIKNLSVFSLEWDFGDGETSTETTPTHIFESSVTGNIVSLIINGSAELTKKKRFNSNGELSDRLATNRPGRQDERVEAESESINESNDAEMGFSIPFRFKTYIDNAIRLRDAQSLTSYLNSLAQQNVIELGRQSDVSDPQKSYLAVVNPQNRRVVAILSPIQISNRFNIITNEAISDEQLSDKFRGMGSIWFQFK